MTALIVLTIITAYLAGAAAATPRLMRLIYRDNIAILAQNKEHHEERMAAWRASPECNAFNMPLWHDEGSELDCMREARRFGYWLALVWPISLSFYRFGDSAFKQEIAAQHAKANSKVIADYDKLLAARFDKELASTNPADPHPAAARKIIRTLTRKEYS